ncbi:hypothetical protein FOZ63_012100, partial [Perkinsus olseni]
LLLLYDNATRTDCSNSDHIGANDGVDAEGLWSWYDWIFRNINIDQRSHGVRGRLS